MLPFFIDPVLRLLPLVARFHSRSDRTYFDPLQRTGEIHIECKRIGYVNIASGGVFLQNLVLCTCQRLQISLQFDFRDQSSLFDFLKIPQRELG